MLPFAPAGERPWVMGIVNVTPDSFSDGGRYLTPAAAIDHGLALLAAGADLLDLGAESTRPGAAAVSAEEELRRLLPVVRELRRQTSRPLSIDTSQPEVMRVMLAEGVDMINDVRALQRPGALAVVAASPAQICLMHMQGEPQDMQQAPFYADVVGEVRDFLAARVRACVDAGIASSRLWIDPGFGFGKDLTHNLTLLAHLDALQPLGCALLVGMSRKRMLAQALAAERSPEQRLPAGLAAHLWAVEQGARIVRVHDVAAMADALRLWWSLKERRA